MPGPPPAVLTAERGGKNCMHAQSDGFSIGRKDDLSNDGHLSGKPNQLAGLSRRKVQAEKTP